MPTGMHPAGPGQMPPAPGHNQGGPVQMNPGMGPHNHPGILVPQHLEREHMGGPPMGPPMMHHGPHVGIPVSSHHMPGGLPHHPHQLHPHHHPNMPMHRAHFIAIGRILIPRYFRSIYESGCGEFFFYLRVPRESAHPHHLTLESECVQIMNMSRPSGISVHVEGRLNVEFSFEDLRIRSWTFNIRNFRELVIRPIFNFPDPGAFEHISKNITRCGIPMNTLNFLRMCVILEPMQELMSRQKAYSLSPRDCLKTTLFQKWQRMLAPQGQSMKSESKPPSKRRKRKGSSANSDSGSGSGRSSKRKQSPGPLPVPNIAQPGEVMIVGEPTLMGGDFGDEDERRITRLENTQFDLNCTSSGMPMPQHPLAANSNGAPPGPGGPMHHMNMPPQQQPPPQQQQPGGHPQMVNPGNLPHMHGNPNSHGGPGMPMGPGGGHPPHLNMPPNQQQQSMPENPGGNGPNSNPNLANNQGGGNKPPLSNIPPNNPNYNMPPGQQFPPNQQAPPSNAQGPQPPHNFPQMPPSGGGGNGNNGVPSPHLSQGAPASVPGQSLSNAPSTGPTGGPPSAPSATSREHGPQQGMPPGAAGQSQQMMAASSFSGPNTPVGLGARGGNPVSGAGEANASPMFLNSMNGPGSGGPVGPPPRSSSASGMMMGGGGGGKAPALSSLCSTANAPSGGAQQAGNMSSNSSPLMPSSGHHLPPPRPHNATPPPQLHYQAQQQQSFAGQQPPSSSAQQPHPPLGGSPAPGGLLNAATRSIPSSPNNFPGHHTPSGVTSVPSSSLVDGGGSNGSRGPNSVPAANTAAEIADIKCSPKVERPDDRFEECGGSGGGGSSNASASSGPNVAPDRLPPDHKPKLLGPATGPNNDTPPPLERNELSEIMDIN